MLDEYDRHCAERAALGLPPRPLTADQVTEIVAGLTGQTTATGSSGSTDPNRLVDLLTHQVGPGVGSAAAVKAMEAEVYRGDLSNPGSLRAAVTDADAVVHLAFDHATMMAGDFPGAVATDLAVVQAFGDEMAGTGKTLLAIAHVRKKTRGKVSLANTHPRTEPSKNRSRQKARSCPSSGPTPHQPVGAFRCETP